MKDKYQFAQNKPDDKRRRPDRRKRLTLEDAVSNFLQKITPLLKQFKTDMEAERRIADAREQIAKAELRTVQAIVEIVKMTKEQSGYKRKSPKVLNEHQKMVIKIIAKRRNKGETFEQINSFLKEENISTFSGRGKWHAQTVHRIYIDHILPEED